MEKAILVRGEAVMGFVVGLLFFLMQTDSRGEALQTFKLLMEPGALVMVGGGLIGISCAVFAFSFLEINKKHNKE